MTRERVKDVREVAGAGQFPHFALRAWEEAFGVRAGITSRGPASDPFDLGLGTATPVSRSMQNWRSFRSAQRGFETVVVGNQVHGREVSWNENSGGWVHRDATDGHATASDGVLLTVTVADCVPIFLLDPVKRACALLHSGWRGTASRILERGIATLQERVGTRPSDLVMHCGVAICGECYEVGGEVLEAVGLRGDGEGPWALDLRGVLTAQAARLGITSLSSSPWCTSHSREHFFSHRGSRGADGRMLAYLGFPTRVVDAGDLAR